MQSLFEHEEDEILHDIMNKQDKNKSLLNGFSLASEIIKGGGGVLGCLDRRPLRYTHLLQVKGDK